MAAENGSRARIAAITAAVLVAAGVVTVVALADRGEPAARSAAGTPTATAGVPATPTATPTAAPTASRPAVADPQTPAPPATTAGALRERNLPVAALIGRQWRTYVDPGGPEAGFTGNGSWVRARSPSDVVDGLRPIGCSQVSEPTALPLPSAALEGTYGTDATSSRGVALALDYGKESTAAAFMQAYRSAVAACGAPAAPVRADDPLTLVITPRTLGADLIVDTRREYGVDASPLIWTEVVVRSGARVGLITVGVPAGGKAPNTADLAAALHAALPR